MHKIFRGPKISEKSASSEFPGFSQAFEITKIRKTKSQTSNHMQQSIYCNCN